MRALEAAELVVEEAELALGRALRGLRRGRAELDRPGDELARVGDDERALGLLRSRPGSRWSARAPGSSRGRTGSPGRRRRARRRWARRRRCPSTSTMPSIAANTSAEKATPRRCRRAKRLASSAMNCIEHPISSFDAGFLAVSCVARARIGAQGVWLSCARGRDLHPESGARVRGWDRRGRRSRPRGGRRGDLRVPGTERRREDHDGPDADHAAHAHGRARHRRGPRRRRGPGRRAPQDRRRAAGGRAGPPDDRPRADPPPGDPARHAEGARPGARRRPAPPRRARPGRRPPRRHLLGRDAAPPRPRRRARARAVGPLPRRAHHRPRPGQPPGDLGGGHQAERRGDHRLPDDPVPGGGRPARRPRRDHHRWPAGRRGNARAS